MQYLLWGLLNIFVIVGFFVICFRATMLLREKFGILIAVFFVVGLLSFAAAPGNHDTATGRKKFNIANTNSMNFKNTGNSKALLHKNMMFSLALYVQYGFDDVISVRYPLYGFVSMTGFNSGIEWETAYINVYPENDKFRYFVHGTLKWKLGQSTIIHQGKEFKGTIELE